MSNFLFRSYCLKFQKTLGETAVDVASIRKRLEEEPLALLGTAVGVQGWKLGDELSNATQHGAHLHQVWPAGSRRQIVQKHSMRRFSTRRTWPAQGQATPAAGTRRLGKQRKCFAVRFTGTVGRLRLQSHGVGRTRHRARSRFRCWKRVASSNRRQTIVEPSSDKANTCARWPSHDTMESSL